MRIRNVQQQKNSPLDDQDRRRFFGINILKCLLQSIERLLQCCRLSAAIQNRFATMRVYVFFAVEILPERSTQTKFPFALIRSISPIFITASARKTSAYPVARTTPCSRSYLIHLTRPKFFACFFKNECNMLFNTQKQYLTERSPHGRTVSPVARS